MFRGSWFGQSVKRGYFPVRFRVNCWEANTPSFWKLLGIAAAEVWKLLGWDPATPEHLHEDRSSEFPMGVGISDVWVTFPRPSYYPFMMPLLLCPFSFSVPLQKGGFLLGFPHKSPTNGYPNERRTHIPGLFPEVWQWDFPSPGSL